MNLLIFFLGFAFLAAFIWHLAATLERVRRWSALTLVLLISAVCALSLFRFDGSERSAAMPWPVKIKPGIDLRGGTQFTLQLAGEPSERAMDQAVEVIRKRIDPGGTIDPIIQPASNNRIMIQIAGIEEADKDRYRTQLQRVARLEFRMVHPQSETLLQSFNRGEGELPIDYEILPYLERDERGQSVRYSMLVRKRADMTGRYVSSARRSLDQLQRPVVLINFDSEGQRIFSQLTADNIGQRMAIVLDNEIYSAPVIRGIITGSCEISGGNMSAQEAEELASVLENPLETPVQIVDERGVDPTLGAASITSGFQACLIGLALVMAFMILYYRTSGIFAVVALSLNILILLGLLAQFGFVLTLPGVAGIILTIGMAVDANVLIFERIREELRVGNPVRESVSAGFNKAFSSILDANVTTLIAALIMFWQGTGAIQGFAVVLCLGILSSLFSALIATRGCFEWMFARGGGPKKLPMAGFTNEPAFNFMGVKVLGVAVSVVLLVMSLGAWYIKGQDALGVDFRGGDMLTMSFQQKLGVDEIRQAAGLPSSAMVQYQESPGEGREYLVLKTAFDQAEPAARALMTANPDGGFRQISLDKVSGTIGKEFLEKAVLALCLGLVGIFLYVMWRFEISFAVGAIVALVHDVVITLGIFTLMNHEFSLIAVGAILTIAGYSINDTIVIFDRIREGLRNDPSTPLGVLCTKCLNATLSRTLLTSGTTLLAVLALYLFGGLVINDFALILLVGIIVGTYSSIFVAVPVVLLFGERTRKSIAESQAAAITE